MGTAALTQLSTELGGAPPPESFGQLGDEQLRLLADALKEEHESRATGLGDAAEEALKLVPALARGPVRRILFK